MLWPISHKNLLTLFYEGKPDYARLLVITRPFEQKLKRQWKNSHRFGQMNFKPKLATILLLPLQSENKNCTRFLPLFSLGSSGKSLATTCQSLQKAEAMFPSPYNNRWQNSQEEKLQKVPLSKMLITLS